MTAYHLPVMVDAFLRFALEAPAGAVVDATLGGGGHVAALLAAMDAAGVSRPVIGVDQDPEALAAARLRVGHDPRFTALHGNFRDLDQLLAGAAPPAAILLDLGVSSRQLDAEHRGFAIKHPQAALDMRMDPTRGVPARDLIKSLELAELARVLRDFGEVRDAFRIADRIKEAAEAGRMETTGDLARLVDRDAPRKLNVHPATLVFQALRIAVNDELGALTDILAKAPKLLAPKGRLLVMSYHSLEDRMVKHTFAEGEQGPPRPARLPPPSDWRPTWKVLTRQAVVADDAEIAQNPRARSARLRVAERPIDGGAR